MAYHPRNLLIVDIGLGNARLDGLPQIARIVAGMLLL